MGCMTGRDGLGHRRLHTDPSHCSLHIPPAGAQRRAAQASPRAAGSYLHAWAGSARSACPPVRGAPLPPTRAMSRRCCERRDGLWQLEAPAHGHSPRGGWRPALHNPAPPRTSSRSPPPPTGALGTAAGSRSRSQTLNRCRSLKAPSVCQSSAPRSVHARTAPRQLLRLPDRPHRVHEGQMGIWASRQGPSNSHGLGWRALVPWGKRCMKMTI